LTWINEGYAKRHILGGMAIDLRKISILEVAGIVTILLSAVLLAGIVYSIWQ